MSAAEHGPAGAGSELAAALDRIALAEPDGLDQLFEQMRRIQVAIVGRRGLAEVLEAIGAASRELLGADLVGLRLIDEGDPSQVTLVAHAGAGSPAQPDPRSPVDLGVGGLAVRRGVVVKVEDYQSWPEAMPSWRAQGVTMAMAAPVRELGEVVGSIVVAWRGEPGAERRLPAAAERVIAACAGYASLALGDARTAQDAIERAHRDPLTGVANRLMAEKRLTAALALAEHEQDCVAVLFVDLDAFKTVNEGLGHAGGDELLVAAAQRMIACSGSDDTVARFGGDEFVVVLPGATLLEAERRATTMLAALEEPFRIRGHELYVSASIGVAAGGRLGEDLLRNADLAMFRAKAAGRGRTARFDAADGAPTRDRLTLETELAAALRGGELVLHHQPIVELEHSRVVACEALVRWQHPERGLLAPAEFIPAAEAGRLIVPLGRWVIEESCRALAAMREHHPELKLHVNLSAAQLNDPMLHQTIATAIERCGLEPDGMLFELTETAFIHDDELVARALEAIKELGVLTAVDDFGTGNASLRHLARFPLDVLKIDRSFVNRIVDDESQRAIARAIIGIGRDLDMLVVAEGIETAGQARFVAELGCALGQGFHFARPVPAALLGDVLAAAGRGEPLGSGAAVARAPV